MYRFEQQQTLPFVIDIETATRRNQAYRRVIKTAPHQQLVLMSVPAGQDIGMEIHPDNDQFIRIEQGKGFVTFAGRGQKPEGQHWFALRDGFAILIPAGTWHNVVNNGLQPLKLYTIYAPPHHAPGKLEFTKH